MVTQTLVGYYSPEGHNHDDNCLKCEYHCKNGHYITLSVRRKCLKEGCTWQGKTTCFCHPTEKLNEWPAEPEE